MKAQMFFVNEIFSVYSKVMYFCVFVEVAWVGQLCGEEPWGMDAALVQKDASLPIPCRSYLARMGEAAIGFHQTVISPADGPRSHFIPSSSEYTKQAMQWYGFCGGYLLGCDRLMRENEEDWFYLKIQDPAGYLLKWDPVPK